MNISIEQTIMEYGVSACREAYALHLAGNGGNTVGDQFGGHTALGDALIDAGRWLNENIS